jgi:hypothetical protein
MKAARLLICISLAAAALAALQGPAAASARGREINLPSMELRMSLPGSHGYRISIDGFGGGFVVLTALRGEAEAEYRVHGRISPHGLHANFGNLGLVSVSFEGSHPHPGSLHGKCKGRRPIHRVGRFKGTIRFDGEEGFTSVSAKAAKGSVGQTFRQVCRGGKPRAWEHAGAVAKISTAVFTKTLVAGKQEPGRRFGFFYENDFPVSHGETERVEPAFIIATVLESGGRVEIDRSNIFEVESKFLVDSPLGVAPITASLTMPSPFAGTAEYLEQAGSSPTWGGNLSVPLPGAASVPMSGPGFKSVFCRGNIESKKADRCQAEANSLFFSSLEPFTLAFTTGARARSAARRLNAE